LDAPGGFARRLDRRQQQGYQYGDDGNHHQQFDQSKRSTITHAESTPRKLTLIAQRVIKPTARRPRMSADAAISRNGRSFTPRTRNERA
jgi:hypothetical protein